jgi:hypothetical protein
MKASIKILKKDGLVVMSNIWNDSISDRHIFKKITEHKPHTLLINHLDGNAMFYYIHKHNFPTVKRVIYFGGYSPQDVDGLYGFEECLVYRFNEHFAGKNFIFMNKKEKEHYENIINKVIPEEDSQNSLCIATTENAKDYFDYIKTNPTFEVLEE